MYKIYILFLLIICCCIKVEGQPKGKVMPGKTVAFYSYSSKFPAHFNVYQKLAKDSLYTHFKIFHQKSTVRNDNLWRITEGNLVKYDGSKMIPLQQLLTSGENEFVWKSARPNVGDFTGGFHGDERIDVDPSSKVTFYADGNAISPSTDVPLTSCSSFYYHQFSTMHQSGTGAASASSAAYVAIPGNPIDSFHEKKTVFENNGFITYNKLTWAVTTPVDRCYYGIFCVNKEVSYEGTNEDNMQVIFNNDGGNKLTSTKQKIKLKNEALASFVSCDAVVISTPFNPTLTTFIWDTNTYHKYYSAIKATTANQGDVWETVATIKFEFNFPKK